MVYDWAPGFVGKAMWVTTQTDKVTVIVLYDKLPLLTVLCVTLIM